MKKLIRVILTTATFLFIGCNTAFADCKHYVTIRNQTDKTIEVGVWLKDFYWDLTPGQEVEFKVSEELALYTEFGVAFGDVSDDNTMELHENGYYWGEAFFNYLTERL